MKQNKYDQPQFFAGYSQMPRSVGGLDEAGEWYILRSLLPDLSGKRVLDLGCGFGWHCRYAREQQASLVVGIDLSEKMLERARELTNDSAIEYRRLAIEDIDFPADEFDVVLSSLAFHYVERFELVCQKVHNCLKVGGAFVFSVEHPIFTCREAQDWHYGPNGERLHWPVDDYQHEGIRRTAWLAKDVVKYHRTVETYVNTFLKSGFRLTHLSEPQPSPELLVQRSEMKEETRRPMFLMLAGTKW